MVDVDRRTPARAASSFELHELRCRQALRPSGAVLELVRRDDTAVPTRAFLALVERAGR